MGKHIVPKRIAKNVKDRKVNETIDPRPVASRVNFTDPVPLHVRIRNMVRSEQLAALAEAQGVETWEEANDFDIPGDDVDPRTPYTLEFDPSLGRELTQAELAVLEEERRRADPEVKAAYLKKRRKAKKLAAKKKPVVEESDDDEDDE